MSDCSAYVSSIGTCSSASGSQSVNRSIRYDAVYMIVSILECAKNNYVCTSAGVSEIAYHSSVCNIEVLSLDICLRFVCSRSEFSIPRDFVH